MAKGKDPNDLSLEGAYLPSQTDFDHGYPIDETPQNDERRFIPNGHRGEPALLTRSIVPSMYNLQDPGNIRKRDWLYGGHYIRKFISSTVAPGGRGKSSLVLAEAIAMASNRSLLNVGFKDRLRVWYWNGEDPQDEIDRRIAAIVLHYKIDGHELEGWLFRDNGRDTPICIAERQKDTVVFGPDSTAIEEAILKYRIDVLILDPFIKTHAVPENDNGSIDRVVRKYAAIADRTNCAIELPHHVRKASSMGRVEVVIDDARGAGALVDAARSARVLNTMSEDEAAAAQVRIEHHRSYFRVDNAKANMTPPAEAATWFKLVSVNLGNAEVFDDGDKVGVVTPYRLPGAFEGVDPDTLAKVQAEMDKGGPGAQWGRDARSPDWIGHVVATALDIVATEKAEVIRVQKLIKAWIDSGALKVEMQARPGHASRLRPVVVIGQRVYPQTAEKEVDEWD